MTGAGRELMLDTCRKVLDMVGDRAEAEVTVSASRSGLTRFANSFIHQNVAESGQRVRLKVVMEGRQATATTTRVQTGLHNLVDRALEAARLVPVDPGWPGLAPPAPPAGTDVYDEATHLAPPDVRAAVVQAFVEQETQAGNGVQATQAGHGNQATQAGHGVQATQAAGYCKTGGYEVAFANSAGQEAWGRTTRAVIEGIHRTADADGGGQQIASQVADLDGAAAGRRAAEKARAGSDPVEVDPGTWEVVLEPNCVVDMLDFLTGHGFNAKEFAEGRSFLRLGEPQFDAAISIFDDATDPRAIGLPFDAEGTPRRRLDLVRAGVPVALAHDRRTARAAGTESTGHAVPGGETSGPIPDHIFLAAGIRTPGEMIASVRRGLLVTDFWYTRILDPKTQVVTGLTRNGTFLIEGGRITRPVRNLRFTQSYVEALAPGNVLGVGDDARLAGESQFHAPTLYLRSWNFTGGAKG